MQQADPKRERLKWLHEHEKLLTAEWYAKMENGYTFGIGERGWYAAEFKKISKEIQSLQVHTRTHEESPSHHQ